MTMREYRQYKVVDPVRLLWRRVLTLILVGLAAIGGVSVWNLYGKERESAALRAQAEHKMRALEERFEDLSVRADTLTSRRGQEAVLRDTYDVGKPGEGLIVIVEESASGSAGEPAAAERPWWQLW